MLVLDAVEKQYRKKKMLVQALQPTSLEIQSGEFIAVIGPSGSGKTTLLSLLGGMLAPTSGRVLWKDQSLYQLSTRDRSRIRNTEIGFVFQHFNLVPWLTALENVKLPLSIYGSDAAVQQSRACELLERFGLSDRLHHKPSELSAGQQQRVALARTLITDPQLILADEPTGNLDPTSCDLVMKTFQELHQAGQTIVLVTHDRQVSAAAERILTITAGAVNQEHSSSDAA